MHRVALSVLRSDDLAWDAVQETLLRAWRFDSFPDDAEPLLMRLVRLSCLHSLRCARRRTDHELLSEPERHHARCCALDPVDRVAGREELLDAAKVLSRMAREHRETLTLVGFMGLSYRDAAERLGVPVGTVRSRTSRARAELRRRLTDVDVLHEAC